jgi:hypothetical protein
MQRLELNGAVRHIYIYIYIYVIRRLKVNFLLVIRDHVTFKAPTILHTNHSESWSEDGSVYEPKHVARNTNNTFNILRVVYYYIILKYI